MKQRVLSHPELASLCGELRMLLHAGVSAGDGLTLLAEEEREPAMKALLTELARRADEGETLSNLLRATGRVPAYAVTLTAVGEQTGRTEEALGALARYYEQREQTERQVRAALTYPALLLLLMLVVVAVLLTRVLPVFDDVYASLGGRLTGVAGGLLALGRWLSGAMPVLLVLLALVLGALAAFSLSAALRERVLAVWRRVWGDRGVSRKMNDARFAQAMAMGLGSGLPMEEAVELAAALLGDVPAAGKRCQDCLARLGRGEGLAQALGASGVLPGPCCRVLAMGLRSGAGDAAMETVARRLTEEAEQALEDRVARVEPALVLAGSLLVGAILLAVMLPLAHIMTAIG